MNARQAAPISAETAPDVVRPAGRQAVAPFTAVVMVSGAALIGQSLLQLAEVPYPLGWMALGALAIVASVFPVKMPGIPVTFSIADTVFITSALLFGPAPATLTIAIDTFAISRRGRFGLRQTLFNTASSALALWCGVQVYYWLAPVAPIANQWERPGPIAIAPLAALSLVYFALNSGLTATAIALSRGLPIIRFWRQHFAIIGLTYVAAGSAAFFLVMLLQSIGPTAFAAVLPLIFICYVAMQSWLGRADDAQRHVKQLNDLYMSTIGAFSTAIEAKDGVTSDHVHRVQAYALGLAKALGVTDQQTLHAIAAASLLHDMGKLAVPEHILNKPGRLTAEEFETMKSHVDVGADILSSIDFPYPVVPIVRAHHENWDGTGYPRQVGGEDIPIGARILAVVDCFDALTSDRPYRPAMSEPEAIDIIVERRGTMYDPRVVDTFLAVYRDIAPSKAHQPALQSALRRIRKIHQPSPPLPAPAAADVATTTDASQDLLAFVSLARVMTQTPTLRDIGMMAWGHLRHLAPGASVSIFTVDASRRGLVAQFTAGPAADRLAGVTMGMAQRVSGWVAANGRAMLNADPHLDLDQAGDLRAMVSLPLPHDGRVTCVLSLYAREPFSELQLQRLEIIAPHLAAALAAADLERPRATASELRVVARRS